MWDVVGGIRVHGRANDRALAHDGRELVFVHGLGMSTSYLEPTMRALAGEFAVSGLDLPGFGASRLPGRVLRLPELADVLAGWLEARGIASPILVGQSHGCQVIVELLARGSGRASAIVLNAPTMKLGRRSMLGQLWLVALDTPREPLALFPRVAREYLRAGPPRILATLADALRDRIEDGLPMVSVPTTIICGGRDPVSPPAWGEWLARRAGTASGGASAARFRAVADAAHALPFSHPGPLAEELRALAARLDGAAGTG